MFLLEIYLKQYHRFSFTKICYIKQSLFTDTVVLHTLPSMSKKIIISKDIAVFSSTPVFKRNF